MVLVLYKITPALARLTLVYWVGIAFHILCYVRFGCNPPTKSKTKCQPYLRALSKCPLPGHWACPRTKLGWWPWSLVTESLILMNHRRGLTGSLARMKKAVSTRTLLTLGELLTIKSFPLKVPYLITRGICNPYMELSRLIQQNTLSSCWLFLQTSLNEYYKRLAKV